MQAVPSDIQRGTRYSHKLCQDILRVTRYSHTAALFSSLCMPVKSHPGPSPECKFLQTSRCRYLTSFKSSTLKTREHSTSLTSGETLRGTEMSKNLLMPPTDSLAGAMPLRSLPCMRSVSDPEATKTTSDCATTRRRSDISRMSKCTSGKLAARVSALGRERLRRVTVVQPCGSIAFNTGQRNS